MVDAKPNYAPAIHPIHGMLGAYPLAFFSAALLTDIAYAMTAQMQWANFSVWLITGGVIMCFVAAIAGIVDALVRRRRGTVGPARRAGALHGSLTIVLIIVAIINGFIHSRDAWTSVVPIGLILSIISTVLVLATSWLGYSTTVPATGAVKVPAAGRVDLGQPRSRAA